MNYYEILNVPKNADAATIKKAYRRKSKACHPDRMGGDARQMVWVNKAYETLSDPEKRLYYDVCGQDKPLTSLEQLARSLLIEATVAAATNYPKNTDIVKVAQGMLTKMLSHAHESERNTKMAKERLEIHLAALSCEADEENDVAAAFRVQIAAAGGVLENLKVRKEAIAMAQKRLKKYKSAVVESVQGFNFQAYQGTTSW